MAILKTKLQKDIVFEFGSKIEDMLESAERECYKQSGAKAGLMQAKGLIENLCKEIDRDLDSGKLGEVSKDILPLAEYIKRWLIRAGGVCENLATTAELNVLRGEGRVNGVKSIVEMVKKIHDQADQKIKNYEALLASGAIVEEGDAPMVQDGVTAVNRPEGVHPNSVVGSPAADLAARRAEAKARKEEERQEAEVSEESVKKTRRKTAKEEENA